MSQPITFNQIKAQVNSLLKKRSVSKPVGIRTFGRWLGQELQIDGDTAYTISQCDSPLALRLALRRHSADDTAHAVQVVVTNLEDADISPDIFTRLHRQRLFTIDRWSLVQQQFAAESIDPRLVGHDWLADAVVEYLGGTCTAAAKSGFLDADTLWRELLRSMIGLTADVPDLAALLRWSLNAENIRAFRNLPDRIRKGTEEWLRGRAGNAADFVFAVADHTAQPDAVPLALAVGVLCDHAAELKAQRSIGMVEAGVLASRKFTPDMLSRAAGEAASLLQSLVTDPVERRRITTRAEELLGNVEGTVFAHASPILPLGYTQRLAAFAKAIQLFSQEAPLSLNAVTQAAARAYDHEQADLNVGDRERLDMVMRLSRWLESARALPFRPESLAESVTDYLATGSYVDWARSTIGRVAPSRELAAAVMTIHAAATKEQEHRAQIFAELLANTVSANGYCNSVLLVEQILDAVVVPIARTGPVLLVVLDGMSAAVCRELVDSLRPGGPQSEQWSAIVEAGQTSLRPALAAIPSETKYSRASLLAGCLRPHSRGEKNSFETHKGLVAVSSSGREPVLYTKSDLPGNTLPTTVRDQIANPAQKVIGVIVNATDDILAKADQIAVRWSLKTIPLLEALLYEAKTAGRTVVLTSDHGHILESGTQARVAEGGERWRPVENSPLAATEILMRGPRVLGPGGELITSWSEGLRYIASTKRGYHGGVNPQEMIVPISVLIPAGWPEPRGWTLAPEMSPAWWDAGTPLHTAATRGPGTPLARGAAAVAPTVLPSGMLFDKNQAEASVSRPEVRESDALGDVPDWITRLFSTEVFAEQKKLAARGYPGDEVLKQLLAHLDARGGKMTSLALARSLTYAPFRLSGLLSRAQKLFNVDGYPVISVDASDTVQLEKQILLIQFGLPASEENVR